MPEELTRNTTMPTTTVQEPHVVAMKTAPLKAQTPAEVEVEVAEVFAEPAPEPDAPLPHSCPRRQAICRSSESSGFFRSEQPSL
jgi:hypothetical protein